MLAVPPLYPSPFYPLSVPESFNTCTKYQALHYLATHARNKNPYNSDSNHKTICAHGIPIMHKKRRLGLKCKGNYLFAKHDRRENKNAVLRSSQLELRQFIVQYPSAEFNLLFRCSVHIYTHIQTHAHRHKRVEHEAHHTNSITVEARKTYNEIFFLSPRSSF